MYIHIHTKTIHNNWLCVWWGEGSVAKIPIALLQYNHTETFVYVTFVTILGSTETGFLQHVAIMDLEGP